MLIRIFYTEIADQDTPDLFKKILGSFPDNIKEKIGQYTGEKERQLRITGKALLVHALKKLNVFPAVSLENYGYASTRQPLLQGSDIQFSISHSGNMVLCAVARGRKIGADVERQSPVKLDLMKFYFDTATWQEIISAPDANAAFYRHWTMREAGIKASGLGLEQMELADILTEEDTIQVRDEFYFSRLLSLNYDYTVCIASDKEIGDLELNKVEVEELL